MCKILSLVRCYLQAGESPSHFIGHCSLISCHAAVKTKSRIKQTIVITIHSSKDIFRRCIIAFVL
jgi:hypothetical protein